MSKLKLHTSWILFAVMGFFLSLCLFAPTTKTEVLLSVSYLVFWPWSNEWNRLLLIQQGGVWVDCTGPPMLSSLLRQLLAPTSHQPCLFLFSPENQISKHRVKPRVKRAVRTSHKHVLSSRQLVLKSTWRAEIQQLPVHIHWESDAHFSCGNCNFPPRET